MYLLSQNVSKTTLWDYRLLESVHVLRDQAHLRHRHHHYRRHHRLYPLEHHSHRHRHRYHRYCYHHPHLDQQLILSPICHLLPLYHQNLPS